MTGTSVKNVGNLMNIFPQNTASTEKSAASGFQEIFNSHADRNSSGKEEVTVGESSQVRNDWKAEETLRQKTEKAKLPKAAETGEAQEIAEKELSEEELEEAMEVLGGAAEQLLEEIAQLFGLSAEELQGMLKQLGMEPMEVLNPEKLSALLLMAGGAEDSFSLLTNAELYENYRTIMGRQEALLQQIGEKLGLDSQQLAELLAGENGNADMEIQQNPITVEVSVEKQDPASAADETAAAQTSGKEGLVEGTAMQEKTAAAETADKNGGQSRNAGDGRQGEQGQAGNLLLQNMRTESFQSQVQQLAAGGSVWDADTQDIMQQILDYMKIQIKPEETTLEMQLHPESLGTVHVQVASKGGALTAHFVTQNEAVKAALESQMIQLKESFHEQGVKVEAIEVTVQPHEFDRSFDENRGGAQEETGRKARSRRINLSDPLSLENLEEEEVLAADIMSAQGSTVYFTA